MDPWYKVATPRKEVREGRSFNPDEFAIALEQVVAGKAAEKRRGSTLLGRLPGIKELRAWVRQRRLRLREPKRLEDSLRPPAEWS
jgi:hypothetical protein